MQYDDPINAHDQVSHQKEVAALKQEAFLAAIRDGIRSPFCNIFGVSLQLDEKHADYLEQNPLMKLWVEKWMAAVTVLFRLSEKPFKY